MMSAVLLAALLAQNFEQRGYFENSTLLFPQSAADDSGHAVNETVFHWDVSYKASSWLKLNGSFEARVDSHRQDARDWSLDFDGRSMQRPAFSLRQFSATIHKGKVTAELGRQFIRWGRTDILTPTDRFAPRDYLGNVVDSDFLGVIAARATIQATSADSLDLVWQPWFTPSRTPLLNQRWTVIPPEADGVAIVDAGARYPGGSQFGARWNHTGSAFEYSLCFFDGENNLPLLNAASNPSAPILTVQRYYPSLRLYGGDAAAPLKWVTVKGEAAYFTTSTPGSDEYVLYVLQLERVVREWTFVGGYAGQHVTRSASNSLSFNPDLGFAGSFVGRAAYTIDVTRSLAVETAVRAAGSFARFEYSQAFGQHWRGTAGVAWIRGATTDFIGEYHRNSYVSLALRYSF